MTHPETVPAVEHHNTVAPAAQPVGRVPDAAHHHDHFVQFYEDESFLASVVSEFLTEGLSRGEPVVVIATAEHRSTFLARLRDAGVDVARARHEGRLTFLDARETLNKFMDGLTPNRQRFQSVVGAVIERSLRGRPEQPVRAYGEMVDLLWKDGNTAGAIRLEELWNDLATDYRFSLLCAYSMANFYRASDTEPFRDICRQHSRVAPTETFTQLDDAARLIEISVLQQRARLHGAEVHQREALEQRLRDAVIALQEREQDLRDVLDNAAEGIHLVGPDGTIQWANAAELELLGYAPDEYIGRHIAEFHAERSACEDILGRLSRGETLHAYPAQLRHRDGSLRHVLINSNVRWRDGEFLHTRCFTTDVTAIQEATAERERLLESERAARAEAERARADAIQARAVAEQANRAKSEFLAVMSHELRTPLNAIGGYAELMELGIHGPVAPQQREALDRIQRSQRMLLGLINQVLNYARVESGTVRYDLTDVPLDESLRGAEALVLPQIRAQGLRFEFAGCDRDLLVHADGEKLQQIMLNLLTNAIKFTERDGSIRVYCETEGDHVLVSVCDTGPGIPEDKLESIFDPFVQVDSRYARPHDGVGLGLAISRDLARGMGGDLFVSSEYGKGACFTVRLRMAAPRGELH